MVIYDRGCLIAGEEWVERNLVPVAGVAVAVSVLQVAWITGVRSQDCTQPHLFRPFSFVILFVGAVSA